MSNTAMRMQRVNPRVVVGNLLNQLPAPNMTSEEVMRARHALSLHGLDFAQLEQHLKRRALQVVMDRI